MKQTAFYLSLTLTLSAFLGLLLAPTAAMEGAQRGLRLCCNSLVPSLFPFVVLSGILTKLGLPELMARGPGRLLSRALCIPPAAVVPLALGLTGGYPIGAAALADVVRQGKLTARDAGRLLPLCNNTGPAFIIGVAGVGVFGSARLGMALYGSHVLSTLALCLASGFLDRGKGGQASEECGLPMPVSPAPLTRAFSESVKNAVVTVANMSGFVVFFSVVTALTNASGAFSGLAGRLAAGLGLELTYTRALLTGLLELGSGISAMNGLPPTPGNLALAAFLLSFGGLSVHCQAMASLGETEISGARLIPGRIMHGLLSAAFAALLA